MDSPPTPRAPGIPPVLFALFFVSGVSGLMFEIVWVRVLGVQFGTTAPAISTVLAAFMAGLALGNVLLGPRADRHARPLLLYRNVELGIGISGLAVSVFLLHADPVLAIASQVIAATGPLTTPLRFLLFWALMLLPATLMGGTLPIVSRALVRGGVQGRTVGVLYALNTTGAVAGALLPDLVLVPAMGLTVTAAFAGLGNVVVALVVNRLRMDVPPVCVGEQRASAVWPVAPMVLYGVSGLCAMGYEVIWSRVIQHWSVGRITSFSILLAVFLAFLSIGSYIAAPLADRVRRPLGWAAGTLALTGPAVWVPIVLAPVALPVLWDLLPQAAAGWRPDPGYAHLRALANAIYLQGAACLLMGAALPFLATAAVREGNTGRATGGLYAVNTLAGVFGSVLTGFLLLPWLGAQGSLLVLVGLAGVVGAIATLRFAGSRAWGGAAAGVALAMIVSGFALPADHLRSVCFRVSEARVLVMDEGATTTAAVVARERFGRPAYLELLTPGVSMSSTGFGAQRYMGLMSIVPLLFSSEASDALLICYGVGNSARSLLAHAGLQQLDVVDISPEVVGLSDYFSEAHGFDPLQDPRVKVHVNDGRQFLITTERRYDVITAEPPPPCDAGVVNLYSREYYAAARERLKPGGVLAQWMPVFQMSPDETLAATAALAAEFRHTAMFTGYQYQWFLLGSDEPLVVDLPTWQARVSEASLSGELRRLGVGGVGDLLATYLQGDAGVREATRYVRPVSDDFPSLQYPTEALHGWVRYPPGLVDTPTAVVDMVEGGDAALAREGLAEETWRAMAVMEAAHAAIPLLALGEPEARELAVGNALRPALALRPGNVHLLALLDLDDSWFVPAREHVEAGGSDPAAALVMARRAFYEERWTAVLVALGRVEPDAVGAAHYWLLRGGAERALGYHDAAVGSLGRAARASASRPFRARVKWLIERADDPYPRASGPLFVDERGFVAPPDP